MESNKRSFEVSVTVTVRATVDGALVPGSLPKVIQRWPTDLFDELRREWVSQTGLSVEQFDEADAVVMSERDPSGIPSVL